MSGPVPIRPDLADLQPYGAPQLDVKVRLNTNETAEPPPAGWLEEVGRRIATLELNRYPDRRATQLRAALGAAHRLGPEQVWAANGSNEVLQQLFQAYGGPGRTAVTTRPGYSMYPSLARVMLTSFREHTLNADFVPTMHDAEVMASMDADIVLVANPNNPTGIPVDVEVLRRLHDLSEGLIVVDEAYVEFASPGPGREASAVALLHDCERLVVVRTFSKAYRLAGLRLGYLLGHRWVIDDLRKVRLPYHLDAMKQVAAVTALEQGERFLDHRARVAAERSRVHRALDARDDVHVWPSDANFLLFRVRDPKRTFDGLLERDVLVRDFSDKPSLGGCLRVTIGTHDENEAFMQALRETLDEQASQ